MSSHDVRTGRRFASFFKVVTIANAISALLICLVMVLINTDVGGRYIFNWPLPGAVEVSEVAMVFIVFLALAYVEAVGGNIKIEVLSDRLPQRWRGLPEMLNCLVGIFFFGLILWETWNLSIASWHVREYIAGRVLVPVYPARFIVPVGSALLLVQFILNLIRGVTVLSGREAGK